MKKKIELEDKADNVRNGGNFLKYTSSEIIALQEFALDIKDIELYDTLEAYWASKKFRK